MTAPRDLSRIRWSELSVLAESAKAYRYRLSHPMERSPAMALGSLVHCLVLEPSKVAERYTVKDWDGRTAAGKARAAEVAAGGLEIVSGEDWSRALQMAEAVQTHRQAAELLAAPGRVEVELAWEDDAGRYGGRADLVLASGAVWDLKTTRDISSRGCQRTILDRRYYGQLAWYRWGLSVTLGVPVESLPMPGIIWVSSGECPDVRVQELSPRWVALGDELVDSLLVRRANCEARGEWPGVSDDLEVSEPPEWLGGGEESSVTEVKAPEWLQKVEAQKRAEWQQEEEEREQ